MTGILFIARLGSTRLANKHLIEVNHKTFIEWLISRYAFEFKKEIENGEVKLILATSNNAENKQFELILKNLPVSVYFGNEENIPLRQSDCSDKYGLTNIISVDGDDVLCSVNAGRKIYDYLNDGDKTIAKTSGLPFGMNLMGYKADFLKRMVAKASVKMETGWGRIFEGEPIHEIIMGNYSGNENLRLTLDYELDAQFFKTVISYCGDNIVSMNDDNLIRIILENQFFEINKSLHDEYWYNFNLQKNAEK